MIQRQLGPAGPSAAFNTLPASGAAGAPALVSVGASASPLAPWLTANGISFRNITATGDPNSYLIDIRVTFDPTNLVRPMRPITVRSNLYTDPASPANAKVVTSCSTPSAPPPVPAGTICGYSTNGLQLARLSQMPRGGSRLRHLSSRVFYNSLDS